MATNNSHNSSQHISHELMKQMLSLGRTPELAQAFDHLNECEFCNEAYSGLCALNDMSAVSNLKRQWQLKHRYPLKKMSINLQWFYVIFSIVLILFIAVIVVMYFLKTKQNVPDQQVMGAVQQPVQENFPFEHEQFIITDSVEYREGIPEPSLRSDSSERKNLDPPIEKVGMRSPQFEKSGNQTNPAERAIANYPVLELEGFLLYDYSSQYNNKPGNDMFINNVDARYESALSAADDSMHLANTQHLTSYERVMSRGLHYLKRAAYKEAIEEFDFILHHFPRDINAQFYKALAFERAGNYQASLECYLTLNNATILFFNEPSRYHRAFCLYKLSKHAEAAELLRQINDQNGFYKKQAEELLKLVEGKN